MCIRDRRIALQNGDIQIAEWLSSQDKTILAKAHGAGIRACLHCGNGAYAARAIGWGFDLVTLLNDVRLLATAAQANVAATRKALGEAQASAPASTNSSY